MKKNILLILSMVLILVSINVKAQDTKLLACAANDNLIIEDDFETTADLDYFNVYCSSVIKEFKLNDGKYLVNIEYYNEKIDLILDIKGDNFESYNTFKYDLSASLYEQGITGTVFIIVPLNNTKDKTNSISLKE